MRRVAIAGLLFLTASPVMAATDYFSPNAVGSNSGTLSNPWYTWSAASNVSTGAQPGDTVVLLPGTYVTQAAPGMAGTANAPITIAPAATMPSKGGSSSVIFQGDASHDAIKFAITAAYLTLQNFTVQPQGARWGITSFQSCATPTCTVPNHITIDHVTIDGQGTNGGEGIGLNQVDYMTITNNIVENLGAQTTGLSPSAISLYQQVDTDGTIGLHNLIAGNQVFGQQYGAVTSDGNGIIIDDNQHTQNNGGGACATAFVLCNPAYSAWTRIANNVVYSNNGPAIHTYISNYVDIENNTTWQDNTGSVNTFSSNGEISIVNSSYITVNGNIASILPAHAGPGGNTWLYLSGVSNFAGKANVGFGSLYVAGPQAGVRQDTSTVNVTLGANVNTDPVLTNAPADFTPQAGSSAFNEAPAYFRAFTPSADYKGRDLNLGPLGSGLITAGAIQ